MRHYPRPRRAFTLIEVLIVVIVLGILASMVVPHFASATDDAKLSALETDLQTVRAQIQLYHMQHNKTYPTLANFVAQITAGTDINGSSGSDYGPYLVSIPKNPFTDNNTVTADAYGAGQGWYYNQSTGEFRANDEDAAHRAL